LSEEQGTVAEIIEADLVTPEGVISVERRLGQGDIDLLVNNAGFGTRGEFATMPLHRQLEELDLNIKALVRLTHAALANMVQRQRGNIINVGSTGSFQPVPYIWTYAATEPFVLHVSEGGDAGQAAEEKRGGGDGQARWKGGCRDRGQPWHRAGDCEGAGRGR